MITLSKSSKQEEIIAAFPAVKTGKTVIWLHQASSNPEYTTVFLIQKREGQVDPTNILSMMLDSQPKDRYLRCIQQVKNTVVNKYSVGVVLEDIDITINETTIKPYTDALPKKRGMHGDVITSGGLPIYEVTALAHTSTAKDIKLPMDAETEEQKIARKEASKNNVNAGIKPNLSFASTSSTPAF